MLTLKYTGENTGYEVSFKNVSPNVVQLTGYYPIKTKGFTLYRDGIEDDPWDYADYVTVYKEIEGGAQFSNDGSVYVAPPEPEPAPEPEPTPEPYVPTEEELEAIFEQHKRDKISLSKIMLESFLAENPLKSAVHNHAEGVYSVTSEKQTLMMSQYMTYQIEKAVDPNACLRWNETGKSCEDWTEQEFLQLILEIKAYVYPLVSYQQTLEEQITACTTPESLDAIVIDYEAIHGNEEGV